MSNQYENFDKISSCQVTENASTRNLLAGFGQYLHIIK